MAKAQTVVDRAQKPVNELIDAVGIFRSLLCVEVWEALPTAESSEGILMHVHQSIDACSSKLVYEIRYLVQVIKIIFAISSLYCFPHYSKPNEIETPFYKVLNIFIIERILWIKCSIARYVRRNLVYYVDSVEKDCSAVIINEHSIL